MAKKPAAKKKAAPKKKPAPKKAAGASKTAQKAPAEKGKNISLGKDKKIEETKEKIRSPVEELHREELLALVQNDTYPKPPNWLLSPKMVELFITGTSETFPLKTNGETKKIPITTKFYGDKNLIQTAIVTLASERA